MPERRVTPWGNTTPEALTIQPMEVSLWGRRGVVVMRCMLRWGAVGLSLVLAIGALVVPAAARLRPEDPEYQGLMEYEQEIRARIQLNASGRRGATPLAIPDIFGAGSVLNVSNVVMKVTNNGVIGNPFTNVSSDPSCQWPGVSGIEYMNFCGLAMGAVNPLATDPDAIRRVSYLQEWRPATLDPVDRIYRCYDGIVNGARFVNDDNDHDPLTGEPRIDEDFLDGHDNDGDGLIDEDYAAIGQQMYTCVIRDDTPEAVAAAAAERHVPLGGAVHRGVECWQSAWAYSIPGFTDFDVVNWHFFNRAGHELDSVSIGFRVDFDAGPIDRPNYFTDDLDLNMYPFGHFMIETKDTDLRKQAKGTHPPVHDVNPDSALCPRMLVTVQGFSLADAGGDVARTPGVASFMLIDHTIDPTGGNGPHKVGFRAFRSFPAGQPYVQGGNPTIDQQRFELMTGNQNISSDPSNPAMLGFIDQPGGEQKADYSAWASIGPWLHWPDGGELDCTFAIGVRPGTVKLAQGYAADYLKIATQVRTDPVTGEPIFAVTSGQDLVAKYPSLDNALAAQLAFEGSYEQRPDWPRLTDFPGRETAIKAPPGQTLTMPPDCRRTDPVFVNDRAYSWFDFDCDYCTGAYSSQLGGLFHHTWLAESPPPNPNTNLAVTYNYTDNPDRRFPPAGDRQITVAWDNLSEVTPDPKTNWFDFRGYKVWKVSDWTRPVGATGPAEDDWTLLAQYRWFNYAPNNKVLVNGQPVCPKVYIPQKGDSELVCLTFGDLWDLQSGDIIHPDPSVPCVKYPHCEVDSGLVLGSSAQKEGRIHYQVGRYHYIDHQVKNGFLYFYSVTAFDSTGQGTNHVELDGRRSAVEAEGVTPQSAANAESKVWVVPNPYRGLANIQARPSAWDLTPNASDPTGTHIDFLGLPDGPWTIKVFTLAGDLVVTINSTDAVNASTRSSPVIDSHGQPHANVNRQQDTPDDGQARWNLISRNGQDVVSGIYLFSVSSKRGMERGKFVVIR